jgi:hypothetical protein
VREGARFEAPSFAGFALLAGVSLARIVYEIDEVDPERAVMLSRVAIASDSIIRSRLGSRIEGYRFRRTTFAGRGHAAKPVGRPAARQAGKRHRPNLI